MFFIQHIILREVIKKEVHIYLNIILVLSSITYALKSQELLKRENIYTSLTRSSAVKAIKGCGYGLIVPAEHEMLARTTLQSAGVNIVGSFNEH